MNPLTSLPDIDFGPFEVLPHNNGAVLLLWKGRHDRCGEIYYSCSVLPENLNQEYVNMIIDDRKDWYAKNYGPNPAKYARPRHAN